MNAIKSPREIQETLIDDFNNAIENKNLEQAAEIATYIISDKVLSRKLNPKLQMFCLAFLHNYYQDIHQKLLDENAEDEKFQENISNLLDIAWKYKWHLYSLAEDLNCSLEEIQEYNENMQNLYNGLHLSPAMVHKTLMLQSMILGEREKAQEHFEKWQSEEKDFSQDCDACEQAELINYHNFVGNHKKVLELAKPLLNGEMQCAEVPHICYHSIIYSQMQNNNWDKAKKTLKIAIKTICKNLDEFAYLLPKLLLLNIELGEAQENQKILEEYLDDILKFSENSTYHYMFLCFANAKFQENHKEQALMLAKEYDERNKNNYYQNYLEQLLRSTPLQ